MQRSIKTFAFLAAVSFSITACNDSTDSSATNKDSGTMEKKMDEPNTNTATMPPSPDQEAINYLVPKNASEIAWLNAGIAKGSLKDIKEHSKMMLADHLKLSTEVGAYMAKHPELTMPSFDTTNAVNINDKSGKDWDKAWTDKLVADHQEILSKLDEAQKNVKDGELKSMAAKTAVTVQHHLDMAKMIEKKM